MAGLGAVLLQRGQLEDAYEVLGRATTLDPKNPDPYRNLSIVYRARDEPANALTCLEAALALERLFGWAFSPVAWLIGIPWAEAQAAGSLLGTKLILNELVAYLQMAALPEGTLSPSSVLVMTYALCGFANFGSLGIMVGGMATMCPARRGEIVALGMKSIVAGLLATCLTAAVVGLIIP